MLNNIVIQCLSNTVPFYPENPTYPGVVGQDSYINSIQSFQSPIPYRCKVLMDDAVVMQFHTQDNAGFFPLNYPALYICDENKDVIAGIDLNSAPFYKGVQELPNNTFVDPYAGNSWPLVSSMWEFKFSDFSDAIPDGGIYYLMLVNQDWFQSGEVVNLYSEPIFLSNTHPNTMLLQANYKKNNYLKNVIITGWYNDPGTNTVPYVPTFTLRVEGFIIRTQPKVVNTGYLQQLNQQLQVRTSQLPTFWKCKIGETALGVPWYKLDMVTEFLLADDLFINGRYYILYNPNSSSAPAEVWKTKGEKDESPTVYGETVIMDRYAQQRAITNPFPDVTGRLHNDLYDSLHN